jgi:hypothetical protein
MQAHVGCKLMLDASSCWMQAHVGWLLNIIDFFGSQQGGDIEQAIDVIKQKHAAVFEAISVLWKDKVL